MRDVDGWTGLREVVRVEFRLLRPIVFSLAIFPVLAVFTLLRGQTGGAAGFLWVLPVSAVLYLVSSAEHDRLRLMWGALPVRRATVVRGYWVVALVTVALTYVPWLVAALLHLVHPGWGVAPAVLWGWSASLGGEFVVLAAVLLATLRWGSSRGLLAVVAGVGVVFFVIVGVWAKLASRWPGLSELQLGSWWTMAAVLLVGLAVFLAALPWAERIYERQDH